MYTHVYFAYKCEHEKVFQSQILVLLKMLKENYKVLLVLIKNKNTKDEDIVKLLDSYGINKDFIIYNFGYKEWALDFKNIHEMVSTDIRNEININEPVLFHCRGHIASLLAIKVKEKLNGKIKVLYDIRGLIDEFEKMNIGNYLRRLFHESVCKYVKDRCDAYSFVTENLREYFVKHYDLSEKKEYIIIPTCVDENDISKVVGPKHTDSGFSYIYTGTTYHWQNIDDVLKLMCKIKESDNDAKFTLLVDNVKSIEELCTKYGINADVKEVPHKEVYKYLMSHSVGILIRDKSDINKVAAPTKLSEYVSCGLKIIYCGDIGSLDDLQKMVHFKNIAFNLDDYSVEEIVYMLKKENNQGNSSVRYFLWQTHKDKYRKIILG